MADAAAPQAEYTLLDEDEELLSQDTPGAMFSDDGCGEDHLADMFLGDTIIFGGIEFSSAD